MFLLLLLLLRRCSKQTWPSRGALAGALRHCAPWGVPGDWKRSEIWTQKVVLAASNSLTYTPHTHRNHHQRRTATSVRVGGARRSTPVRARACASPPSTASMAGPESASGRFAAAVASFDANWLSHLAGSDASLSRLVIEARQQDDVASLQQLLRAKCDDFWRTAHPRCRRSRPAFCRQSVHLGV